MLHNHQKLHITHAEAKKRESILSDIQKYKQILAQPKYKR